MRIVHVFNTLNVNLGADLLSHLPKSDQITAIALLAGGHSKASLEQAGVRVIELSALPQYSQSDSLRGLKLAWKLPKLTGQLESVLKELDPDVIHTNLWLSDIIGFIAAKGLRAKLFSTQHDTAAVPFIVRLLKTRLLRRATGVVAISKAARTFCQKYFRVPSGKITVIYNGINIERFSAATRPDASWVPVFGVLGRLEPIKGHEILVKALGELKKAGVTLPHTRIFGSGSQLARLKELASALSISDTIEFRGYSSNSAAALSEIDILIQPSLSEGLGVAVIEALASHKLVVASAVGGIAELIHDGESGLLVRPADVHTLAEKLRWILTHTSEALVVRQRAAAWFATHKQQFDIKTTASKYKELYNA